MESDDSLGPEPGLGQCLGECLAELLCSLAEQICSCLCCCCFKTCTCSKEQDRKRREAEFDAMQHWEKKLDQREKAIMKQEQKLEKQLETLTNLTANNVSAKETNPSAPVSDEIEDKDMDQVEGQCDYTNN